MPFNSGQEAEALSLAQSVYERVGGAIDVLFALEPHSGIWPPTDEGWMVADAAAPGHWGLLAGGSEVATPTPGTWELAPIEQPVLTPAAAAAVPMGRGGVVQAGGATSTSAVVMSGRLAGEELEAVDRALTAGDAATASQRLAVLLRLDPALAPVILSEADRAAATVAPRGNDLAAIHLVRGDAYRSLGRDNEAAAAYQQAHQALAEGASPEEPT